MQILTLLQLHWFDLLQSAGIIAGFTYTALAFSLDSRARRAGLIFEANKAHRAIWGQLLHDPALARILANNPRLDTHPVTEEEERFALLLLMHLGSVHQAMELNLYPNWSGIDEDIRHFFSLPIPREVLKRHLHLQQPSFRLYLERILSM